MRIFVRILGIAIGVVLLLLIAVAIAVHTIDVNAFVGPIQARVKQETGRDLAIRGGIDLKLSLEPKIVISDVTLGNAPWGSAPALVSAKRVEAQVALLPLLQRRFEIIRFALIEPTIALETDAHGQRNWDFGSASGSQKSNGVAGAGAAAVALGNVEVENGVLTYHDGASGKTTNVAIDRLMLNARTPQSPVNAEFRGRIDDVPVSVTGSLGSLETLAERKLPYPIALQGDVNGQKTSLSTKVEAKGNNAIGLDDLALAIGPSSATGVMTITTGGPRPVVTFKLAAPQFSVTDLPLPVAAPDAKAKAKAPAPPSRWVFDEEPISFAALRSVDADGDVAIDKLLLRDGRHVDGVRVHLGLHDGLLDVPTAQLSAFGGTLAMKARVDARSDPDDRVTIAVDGKALDLAAIAAATGTPRDIKGGKTDVAIDVSMHGDSPRQWVSTVTGNVSATVGPATLVNPKGTTSQLDEVLAVVNPFRGAHAATELKCMVIRLPIRNGIAQFDRTVAAETDELGVAASGTVDFRNETLDIAVKPHVKQGVPIDVGRLAGLVRVGGTFKSPSAHLDRAATAATVAEMGAAAGTGGLAAAAALLLKPPSGGDANTCDVAAGRAPRDTPAPASKQAGGPPAGNPSEELGKTLGKLFHR